ncbi:MAG: guanylate kinase [Candidatus Aphodosoma sp.]
MSTGKLIIFSAPSGSGKSTIISRLKAAGYNFDFSVSATSRAPRGAEQNGVEYWFLSVEEFKERIKAGDFVEYEEVYPGCFYGTLASEINSKLNAGRNMMFDVDVKGGLNIKRRYTDRALALFIQPPNMEVLRTRLTGRGTDSAEMIEKRLAKAEWEMSFAHQFDAIIVNDDLDIAVKEAIGKIDEFLEL